MSDIKFTHTHEWLRNGHDETIVGITEHAQQLLGDMVFIEMPAVGEEVRAGDELGVVESVKAASDFYSPISGVVTAINQQACDHPELVNQDPYGAGWLVKIRPVNPNEWHELLTQEQYDDAILKDN